MEKLIVLLLTFSMHVNAMKSDTVMADQIEIKKQMGNSYMAEGELEKALEHYLAGLNIARQGNFPVEAIGLLNNIGVALQEQGELSNALKYHLQSLELSKEVNDREGIAASSNNIGIVHYKTGKPKKAMEYFSFSLQIKKELNDTSGMRKSLNNIASVYLENYKYDSALMFYNRSLMLEELGVDQTRISITLNNIGQLHLLKGDLDKAEEYFSKAQEKNNLINNPHIAASLYDNMGQVSYYRKDYQEAINYFDSCMQIAEATADHEQQQNASLHLSRLYSDIGQYKSAYEYFKRYESLSSRLFVEKNRVIESEALFLKQQKENEILRLEKARETKKLQISILISILIFIVFTGIVLFVIFRLHQKTRFERSLAEQQRLRFQAVMEAQELERKRIAGDLHDSIGQLLSVVKMSLSDLEDTLHFREQHQQKQLGDALKVLDEATNEVRSISHNLMPSALIRSGFVPALREMVTSVNKTQSLTMELEVIGFPDRLIEKAEISLYRVLQEMTNNIIRHSGATEAKIILFGGDQQLMITVTDNGKGISQKQIEHSPGIGWKNIYSRTAALKADIEIQKMMERGSKIVISLPVPS